MPWDTSEAESARERTRVIRYINEVAATAAAAAAAQLREGGRERGGICKLTHTHTHTRT